MYRPLEKKVASMVGIPNLIASIEMLELPLYGRYNYLVTLKKAKVITETLDEALALLRRHVKDETTKED